MKKNLESVGGIKSLVILLTRLTHGFYTPIYSMTCDEFWMGQSRFCDFFPAETAPSMLLAVSENRV